MMHRTFGAALIAAAFVAAVPAGAQEKTPDSVTALLRAQGETYSRASDAEQNPVELRTTQALNAGIAASNDMAASQEDADIAAYNQAQAQYQADVSAAADAQARYDADVRAAADAQARYAASMELWRATVRACEAGDTSRCAAGSKPGY